MNLSGVYTDEGLDKAIEGSRVIDLSALDGTNCFCDDESAAKIRGAIADLPLEAVHWIDSGDYHYISRFWLERIDEPFALLLVDHHPDMHESAFGALSCGSWARDAFTSLERFSQLLMVGINPDLELEFLDLMFDGVLAATKGDLGRNDSALSEGGREMLSLLEARIPVYISIDKDALSPSYAATDWDQGNMSLRQLELLLGEVASKHRIIGVDICGELTREKGAEAAELELNLKTNLAIKAILESLLGA